jgi:hypothetical protein
MPKMALRDILSPGRRRGVGLLSIDREKEKGTDQFFRFRSGMESDPAGCSAGPVNRERKLC